MTPEFQAKLDEFIVFLNQKMKEYWAEMKYTFAPAPTYYYEASNTWVKVYKKEQTGQCIHCFIAVQDNTTKTLGTLKAGDIMKPASYKAPAKHARGNLFQENFGNCVGNGNFINYLK